jgi:Xaa-Pro aminopeptidase
MDNKNLLLLFLFIFPGCTESFLGPPEETLPSKLYPYAVTYDAVVFKQRRDYLVQQIPSGGIVLLTTNDLYLRNGDVNYDFRPASTFYYLTGFEEPRAVAVLRKDPGNPSGSELIMFVEERKGTQVQWLGPVYGPEGAVEYFGADSAYAIESFPGLLGAYLGGGALRSIYSNLEDSDEFTSVFVSVAGASYPVLDVKPLVDGMRLVKSPLEIGLIRRAVEVSVQAFAEGIRSTRPLRFEYEVAAIMEYVGRVNGCPRMAFPTIVASGQNITTLHYESNARQMQAGDLVMIDFGVEYGYYAADVTRTLPVDGRFSTEQAAVYDIVKAAHDTVLAAAKPGVSYYTLLNLNNETLIDGLLARGIITGTRSQILSSGQYRLYIPAGLAHSVGLDVHDPWTGDVNNDRILREGMVLAVEPHIYLGSGDTSVDTQYRGVCARIEDDILITSWGREVLSAVLPSARAGIEAMMNQEFRGNLKSQVLTHRGETITRTQACKSPLP